MRRGEQGTTLADVRVGGWAVLVSGSSLDARQARRLVELGLRPGATVRVMMRTAGGGRVLGVDNLRIVVDKQTLGGIPVILPVRSPSAVIRSDCLPGPVPASAPGGSSPAPARPARVGTDPTGTASVDHPAASSVPSALGPGPAGPDPTSPDPTSPDPTSPAGAGPRNGRTRRLHTRGRRLRLLGRHPNLVVLPGDPLGEGTD